MPVFKNGKIRCVVDSRNLNLYCSSGSNEGQAVILENVLLFRSARRVATLDITRAFNSLLVTDESSKYLVSFACNKLWKWRRVPFGTCWSPQALFQSMTRIFYNQLGSHPLFSSTKSDDEPSNNQALVNWNDCKEIKGLFGETVNEEDLSCAEIEKFEPPPVVPTDFTHYVDDLTVREDEVYVDKFIGRSQPGTLTDPILLKSTLTGDTLKHQVSHLTYGLWKYNLKQNWGKARLSDDKVDGKHLGYIWKNSNEEDMLSQEFSPKPPFLSSPVSPPTKAVALQTLQSFYDPAGCFIEHSLRSRQLVRRCHEEAKTWSSRISQPLTDEIKLWADNLSSSKCEIERCVDIKHLFIFLDASQVGWSVDCYGLSFNSTSLVRYRCKAGSFSHGCKWSTPKRELLAMLQAARQAKEILEMHKGRSPGSIKVVLISDALVNILRLRKRKLEKTMTKLEVKWLQEIRTISNECHLEAVHCSTEFNLADSTSRQKMLVAPEMTFETLEAILSIGVKYPNPIDNSYQLAEDLEDICDESEQVTVTAVTVTKLIEGTDLEAVLEDQRTSTYVSTLKDYIIDRVIPQGYSASFLEKSTRLMEILNPGTNSELLAITARPNSESGGDCKQVVLSSNDLCKSLVRKVHTESGHSGVKRTLLMCKRQFYHQQLRAIVTRVIKECNSCQMLNASRGIRAAESLHFPTANPMQVWGIDHCIMEESNSGHRAVLSITSLTTKFCLFRAVKTLGTEETIQVLSELITLLGPPVAIISDCHRAFSSKDFYKFGKQYQIQIIHIPPRSSSIGAAFWESSHKFLVDTIRKRKCETIDYDWVDDLPVLNQLHNTMPLDPDGNDELCAADLLFTFRVRRLWEVLDTPTCDEVLADFKHLIEYEPTFQELRNVNATNDTSFKIRFNDYKTIWENRKEQQRTRLNLKAREENLSIGTSVLIYRPDLKRNKLMLPYNGPGMIIAIPSATTRLIQMKESSHPLLEHVANLVPFFDVDEPVDTTLSAPTVINPLPRLPTFHPNKVLEQLSERGLLHLMSISGVTTSTLSDWQVCWKDADGGHIMYLVNLERVNNRFKLTLSPTRPDYNLQMDGNVDIVIIPDADERMFYLLHVNGHKRRRATALADLDIFE